jgi:probable rRNA maturation factor
VRIAVQLAVAAKGVPRGGRLRQWASAAAAGPADLTLRIVGTAEARRLNRDYRGRDYSTNVLTFGYRRFPPFGDIVLCKPAVEREARVQGKALAAHYAHLVVHGVLHLRGFDHERPADAARMERAERRILRRLGYGDPYIVADTRAR